jgi:hypothetical protein
MIEEMKKHKNKTEEAMRATDDKTQQKKCNSYVQLHVQFAVMSPS